LINKNIIYDKWLSNIFQKDVYRLSFDDEFFEKIRDKKTNDFEQLLKIFEKTPIFIYSRVSASSKDISELLKELGFDLIDIDIQFEKTGASDRKLSGNSEIRFSKPNDEDGVANVSKNSFINDRFHRDNKIPDEIADTIKEKWTRNFYRGKRGDFMIVALKDGGIIGFLQLIRRDDTLIIDLIAVDEKYREKHIAGDMIKFAEDSIKNIKKIWTGTQVSNISSIKLYERLGFTVIDKKNVFHYHGN